MAERKKYNHRRILLVLILLASGTIVWLSPELRYAISSFFDYPLHYREYQTFNIRIPGNFTVHGLDVSKWQQRIDWKRVKTMQLNEVQFQFAFMKATEGTWQRDAQFDANWVNTKKNGIIRGAYHFFLPAASPKAQAVNFIRTVRLQSGDLPPVIDVEEEQGMSVAQIRKYTKEFALILERHYRIKPIIYTNRDFYKKYFADEADFKPYILWIAHYHVNELNMPDSSKWHFWQHSDRGQVNGINEKVDFNVFNGTLTELKQLCVP
jgi:lysozyme